MVSALSLVSLVVWELRHPHPVVNVRLLGYRCFGICCGLMFLVGFLLISTTQLLPQLAQSAAGLRRHHLGAHPRRRRHFDPAADAGCWHRHRAPDPAEMAGADGVLGIGWSCFPPPSSTQHRLLDHLPARILQVIWLPFLFIPISAVSYVGLPPERSNEASALINLMRNLGGSVGVSFVTTMLEERDAVSSRAFGGTHYGV